MHRAPPSPSLVAIPQDHSQPRSGLEALPQLRRMGQEMPDARDRLAYMAGMTDRAACRVLDLVEAAQPACAAQAAHAQQLAEMLGRNASSPLLSLDHARRLLKLCAGYAHGVAGFTQAQATTLSDILLAQDFQDLSGQVIEQIVEMLRHTEQQLDALLRDLAPEAALAPIASVPPASTATLKGPQPPDKALAQDDVDDLLASLGF